MVTVYPLATSTGPAVKPLVNSTPPFAVGPIVKLSPIVGPFVRMIESSPTEGPPPPTSSQPGTPCAAS